MSNINPTINLTVGELKSILNDLPDGMNVIIPVIDEDDANRIFGFRHVRTAGILSCEYEEKKEVLCLNAAAYGVDISTQIEKSGIDPSVICEKILY